MNAIETINLTKQFGGYTAVNQLNLNVPEGSIYGFLGPNGAGKTTTLKMLTGLIKPSGGEILICGGRLVFGSLENRREFGYLPDVPNFYNWMTPAEFLTMAGELFGMDKKELKARTEELLDLVGLGGVKKRIGGFSRGMKQRLGIAQALINSPKVVFMDEPVSALDPIGRKEVLDILKKLAGRVTVFLSSHILSDIEKACDRVAILDRGSMVLEDSIEGLKARYSRRVVSIEIENASRKLELIEKLKKCELVDKIENMENGEVRAHVLDVEKAGYVLPAIIGDSGCALKRYAVIEPTLEEIFMKVVS